MENMVVTHYITEDHWETFVCKEWISVPVTSPIKNNVLQSYNYDAIWAKHMMS